MEQFVRDIYFGEIAKQCKYALSAIGSRNYCLQQLHSMNIKSTAEQREYYQSEVFRSIHSFLTHASNVSRLLWPPKPKQRKNEDNESYENRCNQIKRLSRANELRADLAIPQESLCLENRTLRDHLEHFDERIDQWEENSPNRIFVDNLIGCCNSIGGVRESDILRSFDPTTNYFIFRGESFDLQTLVTAIDKLMPIVESKLEARWPRIQRI